MAHTSPNYSDERASSGARRDEQCGQRPIGTFLSSGDAAIEAAALAADLRALVEAGLIRRTRAGGEIRIELTELGQSTPSHEA
jgi:hypothetical protein